MTSSWQKKNARFVRQKKKPFTLRGRTVYNYSTIYASRMPPNVLQSSSETFSKNVYTADGRGNLTGSLVSILPTRTY